MGKPHAFRNVRVLAALVVLASFVGSGGCGTPDATVPPPLPDSGPGVVSCVFDELDTFTCPDVTLAPPVWAGKCVDGDDCTRRVNGTTQTAGCTQATAYRNVQQVAGSCAGWTQDGGVLPVADSGPLPTCAAGSVAGFVPKWHPPRPKTTACTKTQIDSYLQCLSDATTTLNPASCAEWSGTITPSDQSCLACLSSNETDPSYGPFIALPTELLVNVAGCIALAEAKTDGSGCGGALQADEECQRAACLPTCPTTSSTQITAEEACETAANALPGDGGAGGGACAAFVAAAACAGVIEQTDAGTPAEKACIGSGAANANGQFEAVALAFCGP
jgi:hypothetical protein